MAPPVHLPSGYNAYSRRSRIPVDEDLCCIRPSGHPEKLPRPLAGISWESVYGLVNEEPAPMEERSPKTPTTPASECRSPTASRTRDPSYIAREKSAARQFLWTTSEAVMIRPPAAARGIPFPLAVVCTPFADSADCTTVPISQVTDQPMRCPRCRCYANPHFSWSKEACGRLQCNMCQHRIEVPEDMKADLAANGNCADEDHHPELVFGSVDFAVPTPNPDEAPKQPAACFAIEVSDFALRSGFAMTALESLEELLLQQDLLQIPACILTFDEALNFHFAGRSGRCQSVSMQDVDDPFLPVHPTSLFLDLADPDQREVMLNMVREIRMSLAQQAAEAQSAGGAALRAALEVLSGHGGGDIFMFYASSPNAGIGSLSEEKDAKDLSFLEETLKQCAETGVAVNCITGPATGTALDLDRLQWLSWRTGGDTLHLPSFSTTMLPHLCDNLSHWSQKMKSSAYNCVIKLRCSKGLHCHHLLAPWPASLSADDQSAFEMARMPADLTMAFTLRPELDYEDDYESQRERPQGKKQLFVQLAVLYTNTKGERLLRVHTTAVNVVSTVRTVYSSVSIAPLMALLVKQAAEAALDRSTPSVALQLARECLLSFCLEVLSHYRIHFAHRTVDEKSLAIHKRLLLLPLYVLSARKLMYAILGGSQDRHYADDCLRKILRMPVHSIMAALYPRIYALQSDLETEGLPNPSPAIEDQVAKGPSKAYLITNGFSIWYYQRDRGDDSSTELLRQSARSLADRIRVSLAPYPAWVPLSDLPKLPPKTASAKAKSKCVRISPNVERIGYDPFCGDHPMLTARDGPAACASPCRDGRLAGRPASPPLAPAPCERSWHEQVFLSTIFVEDEGVTEMSYANWMRFLKEQVEKA